MSVYHSLRRMFKAEDGPASARAGVTTKDEAALRRDAEKILQAAVTGVDPRRRVVAALEGRAKSLTGDGRIWVAGFGTAASAMAQGARSVLGERIAGGVLVVPPGTERQAPPGLDAFGAGHPVPDQGGVAGACAIRQLAREAAREDTLLCLISSGGSAMLTLPPEGLPLEDIRQVTATLMDAGVSRDELSCVRKHLDLLKGGRLAREAAPAHVLALILSDVVDDPLDVIASGPVSPDPTRFADAVAVLRKYGIWKQFPLAARGHLDRGLSGDIEDSPLKNDDCFERTRAIVVANGHTAAQEACAQAERLGYDSQLLSTTLTGEAREAGKFLSVTARVLRSRPADEARRPTCVVTTGETGVTRRGDGFGGRNQELALGAALGIQELDAVLVASMGTAGFDGPTEAAGAVVTSSTLRRAGEAGLDADAALARNDPYPLFAALDDLIVSGPTGTDVADIQVMLLG